MSNNDILSDETTYKNPIVLQRADPFVYKHSDGFYYFIATAPEYDRIELRRANTIQGIGEAASTVIWKKHLKGEMGAHIWAPEIHFIDGKWYIYFAAGAVEEIWNIRIYVLENPAENPLEGEWIEKGQIKTKWETFSLDATTFEHKGIHYLVWAQKDPEIEGNTNLYIDSMKNPWTLDGKQVMLTKPEYDWETVGYLVNEGPAVLKKNGKIFISYSASATDHNYCMGLLSASEDSNLLDKASWKKSIKPVFETNIENSQYGPGHNCFTVSEDGQSDILIYHARNYKELQGSPLSDPNRHTRAQKLNWKEDGTPDFGVPVKDFK
jgi:GH43 family beta-xylosidase